MLCTMADLNKEKIEAIRSLEKKLGKIVLAFSCLDISATTLKEDEIAQLKELENELGLALVAVK